MDQFNQLKEFMQKAKTVQEWNLLRDAAKVRFPRELIRQLDASGFISKCIPHLRTQWR